MIVDKQLKVDLSETFSVWTGGPTNFEPLVKAKFDARFSHEFSSGDFASAIIDPINLGFDWSLVDNEGFVAAIADAVSGAAILFPIPSPNSGFDVVAGFNYDPAGVGETGRLLFGVMDENANIGYYVEVEDNSVGASQLVATAYTNNGDNTFAAGTPSAPQSPGAFSLRIRSLNGGRSLTYIPNGAFVPYASDIPDDGLRFSNHYAFIVVSNAGLAGSYWVNYFTGLLVKSLGYKSGLP